MKDSIINSPPPSNLHISIKGCSMYDQFLGHAVICQTSDMSPNQGQIAWFCAVFSQSPTKQSK